MKFLLMLLLLPTALLASTRYLVSTDPAWVVDVWAINRTDAAQSLNISNCGYPNTVQVPAHGFKLIRDAARTTATMCASSGYVFIDGGDVEVYSIARNVNGMRLFLPGVTVPLSAYGTGVLLDVLNSGPDVARVYLYQNGTRGGPVTLIVRDGANREIAREKCDVVPGHVVSYLLTTQVPDGGSVIVTPGWRISGAGGRGINDPAFAPDGETYVFSASGVESGASAPFISVPASTVAVP